MIENNATRLALIDACLNPRGPDLPGVDVKYGDEISPMITRLQREQNPLAQSNGLDAASPTVSPVMAVASSWLNRRGEREYVLHDPPPLPPLPFRRQYRSEAPPPTDSAGKRFEIRADLRPELRRKVEAHAPIIQFNNLRLPAHAGVGPSPGQPQQATT